MSVIVDLLGLKILPEEHAILNHPNTSGVILFARNIGPTREAILSLVNSIHAMRPELIIFIDQEGGHVVRISRCGLRALPAARVYGEAYDINPDTGIKLAQKYGEIMAHDLLACGIDVSLAPVLDVHGPSKIIGGLDRAFHADPDIITTLGGAFICGMHAAGMPAVAKHFPGHGSCVADSHLTMPVDTRTLEEIMAHDLKPFISLIESKHLNGVMPAHIIFPAIDSNYVTGFSSYWLQDILRKKLKFEGIIISDCLGMTGADIGSLLERSTQALEAGCNLLIAANQPRDLLLDCLNQLSSDLVQQNTLYIEQFKKSMLRFTNPSQTASNSTQSPSEITEVSSTSDTSNRNPTKTI